VVEVPEHLLRRSRERREALGLGTGEGPSAPAPAEAAEAGEEEAAAPAAAAARTPAPAAAPTPAAAPEPPKPPPPPPPYVQAALRRKKVPVWVAPVLLALPVWAWIYAGVLVAPEGPADPVLALGQEVYTTKAGCNACHGTDGGGGVGPAFTGGELLATFPDREDHIAWVKGGSDSVGVGNPYGDPNRAGGQRVAKGGMPAFEGQLTDEEIEAVVRYEREVLGGEQSPEGAAAEGGGEAGGGDSGDH
jgi:mono/diheme cytochrome c family protein